MDIRAWADRYPGDPEALQDALVLEVDRLTAALESIAKNTCCCRCQEAALVARAALTHGQSEGQK